MISKVPYIVMLPGIIFMLVGAWYYNRAKSLDDGTELGTRLAKANRSVGNVTIGFGVMLVIVAIPLVVAIKQLG
jgi:uncharacterized membrane protein YjjB (DUF3815 family)